MMSVVEKRKMSHKYQVKLPCLLRRLDGGNLQELVAETVDMGRDGFFCVATDDSLWNVGAEIECAVEVPVAPTAQRVVTIHGRGKIMRVIPGENGKVGLEASAQFRMDVRMRSKLAA